MIEPIDRNWIRWGLVLGGLAVAFGSLGSFVHAQNPEPGVAFSGRVVELDTHKPIVGVEVSVTQRSVFQSGPKPIKTELKTDREGRFSFRLDRDGEGGSRRTLVIRVKHRGYINRQSHSLSVARLLKEAEEGEKRSFESITMEPGIEYSASVVDSLNRPIAGVACQFSSNIDNNPSLQFTDDESGKTDARGIVRVRMPKTPSANVGFSRKGFSTLHHNWESLLLPDRPREDLPPDLGRFVMERGGSLSGRVVDLRGQPIAGYGVVTISRQDNYTYSARTDASGKFTLEGLRGGQYVLSELNPWTNEGDRATGPNANHPIRPRFVSFDPARPPADIVLREVPTMAIKVRFVDSAGKPVRGSPVTISAQLPIEQVPVPGFGFDRLIAALVGMDLPNEDTQDPNQQWYALADPDADGRVEFRVPKDLINVSVSTSDESGLTSFKTRLPPAIEPEVQSSVLIETLDLATSKEVEFIVYRSPILKIRLQSDNGRLPPDFAGVTSNTIREGNYQDFGEFEQVAPGFYRGTGLLPDIPFVLFVNAGGYVTACLEDLKLTEGSSSERTIFLTIKPKPAEVGDLAPPILVTTLDGKARSLADYHGKYVLVAMWSAQSGFNDLPKLKAIHDKFGKHEKFAMLGLNYDIERKVAEECIKMENLDWPHARLGSAYEGITAAYGWDQVPTAILIGPDGVIIAKDLTGDDMEKLVREKLK